MKTSRRIAAWASVCLLAFLPGCAGGGVTAVRAQGAYSNANVSGTYNLELAGVDSTTGFPLAGSGSLTANGTGQFTSGSYSIAENGITCVGALSGSYSVSGNGSGSATLSAVPNPASVVLGCGSATLNLALAVSAASDTFVFSEADSTAFASGAAVK